LPSLQVGASDMAFARMNNFSFWLLPPAAVMLVSPFFMDIGSAASGWTLYPPLSLQMGPAMDFSIFAVHIMGASSIMGAINIIVTILNMRAPGMTLMKMPMFCWTWLITAYLLIAVMPVLAGAVTMLLTDRHFGSNFFQPAGGGDPVLFQHIFWFFGHPEVYIMILPAFGIISQVVPAFSRKKLFGYSSMVYATASIAILSFIVWAHHMFTTGMPVTGQLFFMYATMLVAVPTAVKVFNWVATMWQGSITMETPMLFAVGFIFVFSMGGFTGLILSVAPIDIQVHDTHYVVAHFHYVLVAGSLFAISYLRDPASPRPDRHTHHRLRQRNAEIVVMNNAAWPLVGGLLGWGLSFVLAYWRETHQPVTLQILIGAVAASVAQWAVR
jgi:cytochrome c oxidase subunit 1